MWPFLLFVWTIQAIFWCIAALFKLLVIFPASIIGVIIIGIIWLTVLYVKAIAVLVVLASIVLYFAWVWWKENRASLPKNKHEQLLFLDEKTSEGIYTYVFPDYRQVGGVINKNPPIKFLKSEFDELEKHLYGRCHDIAFYSKGEKSPFLSSADISTWFTFRS